MKWLQKRYPSKTVTELVVGIGRDSRISGPDLTREFIQVLSAFGVRVIDLKWRQLQVCLWQRSLKSLTVTQP